MDLQNSYKELRISFNGPLRGTGSTSGYGYAAVQLINGWNDLGIPVWWGDETAPIAFSFGQPPWYEWQREDQYKIGYTPWESTRLPLGWNTMMNKMDEIWTTSEFCKEWFIKGGVKVPIRVLHHGINAEHFPMKKRNLSPGEPFRFLHIGEPAKRKGGKLVYDIFNDLFHNDPNVTLTLKGNPRWIVDNSNIGVVNQILPQEQLGELYLDHHAFLYPTNGEGFGFLPFQAAASGMPTVVTDWGGCKDFIEYCLPLKINGVVPCDEEPHEGFWADPNEESLKYWMQSIVDSPNYFFGKAHRKAIVLNQKWGWEKFARQSADWFMEINGRN